MKKQSGSVCIWFTVCLFLLSCQKEELTLNQKEEPTNATPIAGTAKVENTDTLMVNNRSLGPPYTGVDWKISWDTTATKSWYIKLSYFRLPSYTLMIYIPGIKPPTLSATYTLQQNISPLPAENGCISFYETFGWETFPHPPNKYYYSLCGELKIDVTNGQVSASFENISLRDEYYKETITLSGHVTCH
jgi:hypothetical protein